MTTFPYIVLLRSTLAALGTGRASYTVPANETLDLSQLFVASTGIFSITDILDSAGQHYTNASPATPIPSTLLSAAGNNYNVFKDFPYEIHIEGAKILYIDIVDTSNAPNVVSLLLPGKRATS